MTRVQCSMSMYPSVVPWARSQVHLVGVEPRAGPHPVPQRDHELADGNDVLLGLPQVPHLLPQLVQDGEGGRHVGLAGPSLQPSHLSLLLLLHLQLSQGSDDKTMFKRFP